MIERNAEPVVALLLTPEQVAAQLQVPVATLRRWVTEGRIPFRRIGRKTRFSDADVVAIIKAAEVEPAGNLHYRSVSARGRRGRAR